jgi:hypothetical protein
VPVRRVRRRRLVLTGGQAEVLAAADARRSVAGIGRELGRTTYGCLVAVRDLTAAGLIEPPAGISVPVAARPVAPEPVTDEPVAVAAVSADPGRLPRRRGRHSAPVPVAERSEPPDRDLLVRLQAALEELA